MDGCHDYENVLEDLYNYYPKLRSGGVIGGHDYHLQRYPGVVFAAQDFSEANDLRLNICLPCDFWIDKP